MRELLFFLGWESRDEDEDEDQRSGYGSLLDREQDSWKGMGYVFYCLNWREEKMHEYERKRHSVVASAIGLYAGVKGALF